MSGGFSFVAEEGETGGRLDVFLAGRMPGMSRSFIQNLINAGAVSVNGRAVATKSRAVEAGDILEVLAPEPRTLEVGAEDIPVSIVYEDESLLVVDKAKGMVVHPAPGNESGTLVNALLFHCGGRLSSINGVLRPGIVHRIDKDTSGLLVVAKSDEAHRGLSAALAAHEIKREYEALVYNNFVEDEGTVDLPIGRDPKNRLRQAVVAKGGRAAVTHYKVLARFGAFTHMSLTLETGRTHQIRVHMAHIRHPLVGDPLYGPKKKVLGAETQLLHAGVLGFKHPATGEYAEFRSPKPKGFEGVLERLREKDKGLGQLPHMEDG